MVFVGFFQPLECVLYFAHLGVDHCGIEICFLGLTKVLNPAMCIFILKNVHGYRDQQDYDHTVNVPEIIYQYVGPVKEESKPYYGESHEDI